MQINYTTSRISLVTSYDFQISLVQGCELQLKIKLELGLFYRTLTRTRTRKIKIAELELELELKTYINKFEFIN